MILAIAVAGLAAWIYLIAARGFFWRMEIEPPAQAASRPRVVAVVPARNEAEVIGQSLRSLLDQDYPEPLTVVLVDDHSEDGTARIADSTAAALRARERLKIVRAQALPAGWTGKVWAMAEGLAEVKAHHGGAEFVLFTDADIAHARDNLAGLVARAEAYRLDMVSLMVRLRCQSWVERAVVPAFVFFFRMLYPFAWVNDPGHRLGAAAGGCMLVRLSALERIGGMAAIRGALIDDCALGRRIKRVGPIFLGLTDRAWSLRGYPKASDAFAMIARSAFTQLDHSLPLLSATVLAMGIAYVAPPLLAILASGSAGILGLLAWIAMAFAYRPSLGFYDRSWLWGLALPAIALFYLAATLESARRYWLGRGGHWKGRVQAGSGA